IAVVAVVVAAGAAAVVAIAVVAVVVALVAVAVALVAVVAPVAAVVALAAGATAVVAVAVAVALVVVSGVLWFRLSLDGHDRLFLTTSTVVARDLDDVLAGVVENDRSGEGAVAVGGGCQGRGAD